MSSRDRNLRRLGIDARHQLKMAACGFRFSAQPSSASSIGGSVAARKSA